MHRFAFGFVCVLGATALAACGDNLRPPTSDPDAGPPPPDSGSPEVPLEREHAGGSPNTVVMAGTRAYIGVGPRLTIWDLSTTPPTQIGESAPLRSVITSLAVRGDRVYAAERLDLESQIHVLDVTTPASPVETHAFSVAEPGNGSVIRDLELVDDRLYVADQEQGVVELGLADPDAPATIQVIPQAGVSDLEVVGERLYFTMESFFGGASAGALDLANGMADLGSSPLGNLRGVAFAEKDLVIGAGPDGIYVYDVTDPANPVERFHHGELEHGPFARAVAASGTTAWVPADDGLHILDLTTPTAIEHTGPEDVPTTNVNAIAVNEEQVAILTDRGRLVVRRVAAGQPKQPEVVDVTLCADCSGITAAESTMYVADIVGGIRTASLADLSAYGRSEPLPVVPDTGGLQFVFEDVQIDGTRAYVADWLFGLRIYDVADPRNPGLVGSLATGGAPSGVAVAGGHVYVAEGTNGGALRVVDVADPIQPVLRGSAETSKAMDVEVRGSIAYVADESLFGPGGLRIFDVSNPAAIVQLGYYGTDCLWASDVAVTGTVAVVACGADGFHFIDVANPADPKRLAVVAPPHETGSATSVGAWDGHAVLGHDRGVLVTSVGSSPQTLATYATSWPVRALAVPTPGRIVAACGLGGVYQWKL